MQNVLSTKLYHTKSLNYKTSSLTYHVARYKGPHTKRLSAQLPHTKMIPKQKKGLMQNVRKKSKTFPKQNVSRTKKIHSTKHPIIHNNCIRKAQSVLSCSINFFEFVLNSFMSQIPGEPGCRVALSVVHMSSLL